MSVSGKVPAPRLGAYCYPQNALGRGLTTTRWRLVAGVSLSGSRETRVGAQRSLPPRASAPDGQNVRMPLRGH